MERRRKKNEKINERVIIMNKERRMKISNVIKEIGQIKDKLQEVLNEEETVFDNMPENLQCSMRGEESEESIDYMNDAIDALDSAIEQLEEI
jgi:flagellar biosynthesis chaperone FliJ